MLTRHEKLVVTALHEVCELKGMFNLTPGTLYGPLKIPGGPLVHLDHVENHWSKVSSTSDVFVVHFTIDVTRCYCDVNDICDVIFHSTHL